MTKYPSSLHEPAARGSSTERRVFSIASSVSDSHASNSYSKWIKRQIGDGGRSSPLPASLLGWSRKDSHKNLVSTTRAVGRISGQDYFRLGRDIYISGHDFHAFPAKKLRKLLTTVSDGVHVFSCVERVGASLHDCEWSEDEFVHAHQLFSKKRPWQVCDLKWGGCAPAGASGGFLGLRKLYQRLTNPNIVYNGDAFSQQDSGSGGDMCGGGYGQGGDGHGGDGLGPEHPGSDSEGLPITTNMHESEQDMEEEEEGCTQGKTEIDDMDIPAVDPDIKPLQGSSFVKANGTILSENEGKLLLNGFKDEGSQQESDGMSDAGGHHFDGVLEHLGRAVSAFYSDFSGFFVHKEVRMGEGNPDHAVHHADSGISWSHDQDELQVDMQDIDRPFADEHFATESNRESKELLEKLRGLTLGSVEPPLLHEEHMQNDKQVTERYQGIVHEDVVGGHNRDKQLVTTTLGMEGASLSKNYSSCSSEGERVTLAERHSAVGQLQGVLDWLARLAHKLSARQGGDRERLDKQKQVEDEKLRALVNEAVASALKQLSDTEGTFVPAKQADTEALRRLQREVFSDLLKIRERLDKIDQLASVRRSNGARNLSGTGKTNLKGEVKAGTAFVMLEDSSSRHSRGSLEQAGMQTGVDVRFTFETPFREKDVLITECVAGQGSSVGDGRALGGPITLGKVHYLAHVNDDVSISFVPIGAQGMDVTDIINPMQDQGLTVFSSHGPALFNHCKGSAIGATYSGSSFAFSLAQYLSGWGNQISAMGTNAVESGPLCLSTLGQFLLQPSERLIFSLSGLHRFWPSPPLPSSIGLHWSEMGPLVIPKIQSLQTSRSTMSSEDSFLSHCNSLGSHWGAHESEYRLDALESKGTALLSVAVASEMVMGENMSLGAWAQIERGDGLQDSDKGNFQWALNLARTSENGFDWGASLGGSRPDFWSMSTNDQEVYPGYVGGVGDSYGPQLHLEAFLKFRCGRGFTLQPGLLYLLNKHSRTPALIVRSSWLF